jgi:hypothetical protein
MNSLVTTSDAGAVMPVDDIVSPELALVDPMLAASARVSLADPKDAPRRSEVTSWSRPDGRDGAPTTFGRMALPTSEELRDADTPADRSWRLLIGVAAITILSLLLLDVRVEVGRTPASAEPSKVSSVIAAPPRSLKPHSRVADRHSSSSTGSTDRVPYRFAWAPVAGASAYHVEFFRGTVRVFSGNVTRPELTIPARRRHDGTKRSLLPGEYRWYVWPVISGRRASQAVVGAKLTLR